MKRYKLPLSSLFLGFLASLLAGCGEKAKMEIEDYEVKPISMSEVVTATGTMESVTQVNVGTQVTGIIEHLYVDYNDHVTKGQLLAELEKTLLESDLKSADANMASAEASYEYAKSNYERDKKLHDEQLISDYEFQTSKRDYDVARLSFEKSKADRVRAAKNLNYAEIYSPIDGIVISREVEVGQTVVSSMNVADLYVIADLENMQVVGNVDEADIGQVKTGQHVTFTVDAYPDDVFSGTVTQVRLNPTTTSNVVTYEVIVNAPNPDLKLIPGMTANLTIYTLELNDVLAVPLKALKFQPLPPQEEESGLPQPQPLDKPAEHSVWILKDNQLVETAVEVGVANNIYQQIVGGLQPGEKVALQYNEVMKNNGRAKPEDNPFLPKPPGANRNKKEEPKK
ncbi:MAG: efflux RND transporter periplasmic adaptor subunit [Muribaculaceae bacterium]|nr:efflux RND transporter periplasmic adaptor subunit [Muribaculaceae bacterium]